MSSATDYQEARVHAARARARAALEEYLHEVLILHAVRADNTDTVRGHLSHEFLAAIDEQFGQLE
jgi:hypothetical protein